MSISNVGYDPKLIQMVKDQMTIPAIASSGAGKVEHFSEVFKAADLKKHLQEEGNEIR